MSKSEIESQGWNITEEGWLTLTKNGSLSNMKLIVKEALDTDIEEYGGAVLPQDIAKANKFENLKWNVIQQVVKLRNIEAPRANEESKVAPRLLKIVLTDGHTVLSALEFEHISALSLNTPPGTKIYLKENVPLKVAQGMLLLTPNLLNVLGGNVPVLVEKWEISRSLAKYLKGSSLTGSSGAPPFIPFGQKLATVLDGKNFKSLGEKGKEEDKEDSEFNANRSEAIAEAVKEGSKKIFGGGNRQLIDHNVKMIMDAGFTKEEAQYALRLTKNKAGIALANLKRRDERKSNTGNDNGCPSIGSSRCEGKRMSKKEELEAAEKGKPSGKVSLFAFFEDKLPATETPPITTQSSERNNKSQFSNYSSNNRSRNQTDSGRKGRKIWLPMISIHGHRISILQININHEAMVKTIMTMPVNHHTIRSRKPPTIQ